MTEIKQSFFQKISNLPLKYGPSWVITIQLIATANYWMILAYLIISEIDISSLASRIGISSSVTDLSNTYAGKAAVAFVLNRFLSPVRIILCLIIVPRISEWLNPKLYSIYYSLTGKKLANNNNDDIKEDDYSLKSNVDANHFEIDNDVKIKKRGSKDSKKKK